VQTTETPSLVSRICPKKARQKEMNLEFTPLSDDYGVSIFDSISGLKVFWDMLANGEVLMESTYLQVLETAPLLDIVNRYGIVRRGNENIGIIHWQIKDFDLSKSLDIHNHSTKWIDKVITKVKRQTTKLLKDNLLVVGNVSLTGDFGYRFCPTIDEEVQSKLVYESSQILIAQEAKQGRKILTSLVKDFALVNERKATRFGNKHYSRFSVEPSMALQIAPHWNTIDDYLSDIKSKARVRTKRAKKLGSSLLMKKLSHEEVVLENDAMYQLYLETASYSTFNLFTLDHQYFIELSSALGDKVSIFGVYYEDELVAFFSTIVNDKQMHAHFLGYSQKYNPSHQVYLNILYWLVEEAINAKVFSLELSRTALEIKSSIGAVPEELAVYVRAQNPIINKLMKHVFPLFIPKQEWVQRSPFKDVE
jgi:hypothetical protein